MHKPYLIDEMLILCNRSIKKGNEIPRNGAMISRDVNKIIQSFDLGFQLMKFVLFRRVTSTNGAMISRDVNKIIQSPDLGISVNELRSVPEL